MDKRNFLKSLLALPLLFTQTAFAEKIERIVRSKAQWKARLPKDAYLVLFEEDTEPSHTSPLLHEKREGTFHCRACDLALFDSKWKYDSKTGWPSFYDAIVEHIGTKRDFLLFLPRTEYHCARCGGHQGHVFEDGPKPTGLRYCNNGLALTFKPKQSDDT